MSKKIMKFFKCTCLNSHDWQKGLRVYQKPNGDIRRVTAIRKCHRCDRGPETFHMGRWSSTTVLPGTHTVADICDLAVKTGTTILMDTNYVECWEDDPLYATALSWAKNYYTNGGKLINGPKGLF
jgi:hypothetical protein